jgi:phosphoribosylamine--glycine ligase
VVGPDDYLAAGLVDTLSSHGIPAFGPTRAAAEVEWSKAYAKELMIEEGIPTASYETFTDYEAARAYVESQPCPIVIKASGLALGKGVVVAETQLEALEALSAIMLDKAHGDAGNEVVIEECLIGREISAHAFCDGGHAVLFPSVQDHKRIFDDDKGPNTGGMGTVAPVPWVSAEDMKAIEEEIVLPILRGLAKRGRPFKGVLFPGIMITDAGPKVIEINARFGDPETQSYMRLLESDLVDIMLACVLGTLSEQDVRWSSASACCVVAASAGYPAQYEKGKAIKGLDEVGDDIVVFHAGTAMQDGTLVTSGGRVLGITATGTDLSEAIQRAYAAAGRLSFEGMYVRSDIGRKALGSSAQAVVG